MWRQEGGDARKAMRWEENIRDLKIIDTIYMAKYYLKNFLDINFLILVIK